MSIPLDDIATKVVVGVMTTIGVACVWWAKRKVADPILDFMVHFGPLLADVAEIKKEVQPNGGKSMRDEIGQIKRAVAVVDDRTKTLEVRQFGLVATLSRPYFETDAEFNWTVLNREVEKLFGWPANALEQKRWIAKVHEADRGRVVDEIEDAIASGRGATATFRIVTDTDIIEIHMEAAPQISVSSPEVRGWSGTLSKA